MQFQKRMFRSLVSVVAVLGMAQFGAIVSAQDTPTTTDTDPVTSACVLQLEAPEATLADGTTVETNDALTDGDSETDDDQSGVNIDVAHGNQGNDAEVADDANNGETANDDDQQSDPNQVDGETADDPVLVGTITVDEKALDGLTDVVECQTMLSLTKISLQDAQKVAETSVGMTATRVELDVEEGSLIYTVTMQDDTEVKVDAGNSAVLTTETADNEQ